MTALLFIMKSKLNYWQGSSRCKVLQFIPVIINYSIILRGEYLRQTRAECLELKVGLQFTAHRHISYKQDKLLFSFQSQQLARSD